MTQETQDKYTIELNKNIDERYLIRIDKKEKLPEHIMRQVFQYVYDKEIVAPKIVKQVEKKPEEQSQMTSIITKRKNSKPLLKTSLLEKIPIIGKKIKIKKIKNVILNLVEEYKKRGVTILPLMDLILNVRKRIKVSETRIKEALDELVKEELLSKPISVNGIKFVIIPKTIDVSLLNKTIALLLKRKSITFVDLVKELKTDPYTLESVLTVLKNAGIIVEEQFPRKIFLVS